MKKLLSVLVIVAMIATFACAFAGCNTDPDEETYENIAPWFKVGVLHIGNGNTDDSGYTFAHQQGIDYMKKHCGFTDEQIILQNNVSEGDPEAVPRAINACLAEGCNVIIGTSYGYMDGMLAAAKDPKNKNIIFSHGTGYLSNFGEGTNNNMNNYFGRIYQARYLSGLVAGMQAKKAGKTKIGYVSAQGNSNPECTSGINAFALGAQAVYPEAEVYVKVVGEWYNPETESKHATALLNMGCEVIAQHCDTSNPPMQADNSNKFSIGYNSDMRKAINSESCLTSVVWNWGVYYEQLVKTAVQCYDAEGNFTSIDPFKNAYENNYYGEYKDGLFDLAPFSSEVDEKTIKIVNQVKDLMNKGVSEWDVFTDTALTFDENGDMTKVARELKNAAGEHVTVDDACIKGSMNYWIKGVKEA